MQKADFIIGQTRLPGIAVEQTLALLDADCSIPFIARYRKERTTGLDEVQISQIQKASKSYDDLQARKTSILKSVTEQGALTDSLKDKIEEARDLTTLEDLYLPYKKKRKTKADQARTVGLEPLAKIIMSGNFDSLDRLVQRYQPKEYTVEQTLQGARYIMAEWFAERIAIRKQLRKQISRGVLESKLIKKAKDQEQASVYADYFDWSEPVSRVPSHRILAVLRGQKAGILKVDIHMDHKAFIEDMVYKYLRSNSAESIHVAMAFEDAYKRLLYPSIEREVLASLKAKADDIAIKVFNTNLEQLLLAAPLGEKNILAIDPGFRTGCKVVGLDRQGNLLFEDKIYITKDASRVISSIKSWISKYQMEAIALGNGTASRETESILRQAQIQNQVDLFIVNESGASIYSASDIAREEFPNLDITVRGAISIGRRLADPLAELVKIDPKSIGVGQYQHDVDQTKLQEELNGVVDSCVNKVGVNINTASAPLLSHVSGIGPALAKNILKHREQNGSFRSREEIKDVPRLGAKAYEQAAAFLRIHAANNPLDNSAVHPESYYIVRKMAKSLQMDLKQLIGNTDAIAELVPKDFVDDKTGLPTIMDILKELKKPGLDPRERAKAFSFDPNIQDISDLNQGMILPGKVNNITNFGCFVDIGIKQSGLVHISRLSKSFVNDIHQHVKLGDEVQVQVIEVDLQRKRIQLAMDHD